MIQTLKRMIRTGILTERPQPIAPAGSSVGQTQEEILKILGRALCIRQVDAGSCNGCELEIQALNNPYYNIEGAGIKFVASPRHADMLLVTGPVGVNMEEALRRTFEAVPHPRLVVAVGDCGVCGGVFGKSYASRGPVADVIPVDCVVQGCPPSPQAILNAIRSAVSFAATGDRLPAGLLP
jgi:Ni,Fe-hydrogenase III small subunit